MYISEKSSINVPFSFVCVRGVAEENALLDSGATENFMDQRMVERLGIGLRPMKEPRRVFNVDGTENKHGTLTHYTLLRVKKGDKNLLQRFYVTSLGADHAIFGYPWLRDFNPNVDWGTGQVLGPPVRIETGLFQTAKQATMERITKMAREQPEWEEGDSIIATTRTLGRHAAQEWAIEANKNKEEQVLPEQYQRHARVFSEEGTKCFPPARPDDMVIKLKLGACHVYASSLGRSFLSFPAIPYLYDTKAVRHDTRNHM